MKKLITLFFTVIPFNSGKNSYSQMACTAEFASIDDKFLDSNGNPLVVKDYNSVVLRTQKDITDLTY
jgi:hypothetical protein